MVSINVTSECTALLSGDRVRRGFSSGSAHALCQPTSCGFRVFLNQRPPSSNLIGTEHSLNRSECRVQNESKLRVIWIDGIQNTEVFPIGLEFGLWEANYFQCMEIKSQRYPVGRNQIRESDKCRKWPRGRVDMNNIKVDIQTYRI